MKKNMDAKTDIMHSQYLVERQTDFSGGMPFPNFIGLDSLETP